jgi:hypothetical protein
LLVFVIWSNGDAIGACLSPVKPNSPGEYKIAGIPGKTYSVKVLGKKYDVPHLMLVRKYWSGNDFGGLCFGILWKLLNSCLPDSSRVEPSRMK